ncbi:MAG: hypothetical protein AAB620_02235 [Patescibacteria group bacterium]|mgnify:FL=1
MLHLLVEQDVNGESVLEAIQRLDDPNQLQYVLETEDLWGGSRRKGFDPNYGIELIVYKIPSAMSFSGWLAKIHETAEDELKDELGVIDQV